MYCGDETGAFVGDVGSHSSRFGWGGDDSPSCVTASLMFADGSIPLSANRPPPTQDLIPIYQPLPQLTSTNCHPDEYQLRDGVLHSLDAWENAWLHANARGVHRGLRRCETDKHKQHGLSQTLPLADDAAQERTITHPLLAVDAGFTHYHYSHETSQQQYSDAIARKQRTAMTEILFEALHAPAAFIAPSPMLASFAHGRQTSLVVDVGATGLRVTPIVDGIILKSAQKRNGRGGEWLAHVQYCALEQYLSHQRCNHRENNNTIIIPPLVKPRYLLHSPFPNQPDHTLFHQWATRQVLYEMITSPHVVPLTLYRNEDWTVPFTKQDVNHEGSTLNDNNKVQASYELPDGTAISLKEHTYGHDFCRLPECFFAYHILPFQTSYLPSDDASSSSSSSSSSISMNSLAHLSIQDLIKASLLAIPDGDIRKEVTSNIILTGSSSLFAQMEQRLSLELSVVIPGICKTKVLASRDSVERRFAPWIGGSILSSLGSFQQLWLSRREYEEYGALLSIQRFP